MPGSAPPTPAHPSPSLLPLAACLPAWLPAPRCLPAWLPARSVQDGVGCGAPHAGRAHADQDRGGLVGGQAGDWAALGMCDAGPQVLCDSRVAATPLQSPGPHLLCPLPHIADTCCPPPLPWPPPHLATPVRPALTPPRPAPPACPAPPSCPAGGPQRLHEGAAQAHQPRLHTRVPGGCVQRQRSSPVPASLPCQPASAAAHCRTLPASMHSALGINAASAGASSCSLLLLGCCHLAVSSRADCPASAAVCAPHPPPTPCSPAGTSKGSLIDDVGPWSEPAILARVEAGGCSGGSCLLAAGVHCAYSFGSQGGWAGLHGNPTPAAA